MNQGAVIGLVAAAIGAYFLLRPQKAYADANFYAPPKPYGPPEPYGSPLPPPAIPTYNNGVTTVPKGIRNHNPMNLRYYDSIQWNGQIGQDADGYARFDTVEDGIRAGVKNLMNGYFGRGINTPQTIIARYAPSHENPTDSYITFIANAMGIPSNVAIQPTMTNMVKLTKAIIHFENGSQPYQEKTIVAGVSAGMQ